MKPPLLDEAKLPEGFDPFRSWNSPQEASDFCESTDNPPHTLVAILAANIHAAEPEFCRELIQYHFNRDTAERKAFMVWSTSSASRPYEGNRRATFLVARDGETWQTLRSMSTGESFPVRGSVVYRVGGRFQGGSFERPVRLPDTPQEEASRLWEILQPPAPDK